MIKGSPSTRSVGGRRLGGLIAAFKAIVEWRESRRWKQAEMAKTCLDEIRDNTLARDALKMLDWEGLSFELTDGTRTPQISHENRRAALRTVNTEFLLGDPGPFIRDAFDSLFDGFERLEHFIRIDLIRFEDVAPAFRYYVDKLGAPDERQVTEGFLAAYKFELAVSFLKRFATW
jgi:hypothetical protein